jgi:hypothetical protein
LAAWASYQPKFQLFCRALILPEHGDRIAADPFEFPFEVNLVGAGCLVCPGFQRIDAITGDTLAEEIVRAGGLVGLTAWSLKYIIPKDRDDLLGMIVTSTESKLVTELNQRSRPRQTNPELALLRSAHVELGLLHFPRDQEAAGRGRGRGHGRGRGTAGRRAGRGRGAALGDDRPPEVGNDIGGSAGLVLSVISEGLCPAFCFVSWFWDTMMFYFLGALVLWVDLSFLFASVDGDLARLPNGPLFECKAAPHICLGPPTSHIEIKHFTGATPGRKPPMLLSRSLAPCKLLKTLVFQLTVWQIFSLICPRRMPPKLTRVLPMTAEMMHMSNWPLPSTSTAMQPAEVLLQLVSHRSRSTVEMRGKKGLMKNRLMHRQTFQIRWTCARAPPRWATCINEIPDA